MNNRNPLFIFALSFLFLSCGSNNGKKNVYFSIDFPENKTEYRLGETLEASIRSLKDKNIDSVHYFLSGDLIETSTGQDLKLQLNNQKLGKQDVQSIVFYENRQDTLSTSVKIYNDAPPVSYTYEVVNSYPHDKDAYTQGLEFHNDILYESTGQYGESSLRKIDLESGEVLQKIELEDTYFGEGLSILNNRIYQLTWNEGEGIIYNLEDFEKIGTFSYNQSEEGWGLCNDGEKLYKSDGTEKIWTLNPENLSEEDYIQVTTHKNIVSKMNELEWVEGKIYANTYQKDGVAIINPENGAIEGLIDFRGLRDQVTQHEELDVLNGIAYNSNSGKLYVTGKNWDRIFEVEITEK